MSKSKVLQWVCIIIDLNYQMEKYFFQKNIYFSKYHIFKSYENKIKKSVIGCEKKKLQSHQKTFYSIILYLLASSEPLKKLEIFGFFNKN